MGRKSEGDLDWRDIWATLRRGLQAIRATGVYVIRGSNTPISEPAIVGIGNGIGAGRHRPVVEIMFGISHARCRSVDQPRRESSNTCTTAFAHCPIVVRTPMGGRRG
ncbi:MAG: hypothetical protein IPP17_31280 [Bacteroidetes bacterium]|nr:hypothetical protein [Bacteroidota bacterium]